MEKTTNNKNQEKPNDFKFDDALLNISLEM